MAIVLWPKLYLLTFLALLFSSIPTIGSLSTSQLQVNSTETSDITNRYNQLVLNTSSELGGQYRSVNPSHWSVSSDRKILPYSILNHTMASKVQESEPRDVPQTKLGRTSDSNETYDKGSWVLLQLQGAVVQLNIDPKKILMMQFNASSVAQFGAGYVITVNGTVQEEVQKDLLDDLGYSGSRIIQRNSTTLTTIYTSPESVIATFLGKRLDTDVQVINSAPVQYEIRTNITREALDTLLAPVGGSIAPVNNSFVEGLMPDTVNLTKSILNDKLERLGISGASVLVIDNKFVLVHMPDIDPVTAQDIVSKPGMFEIRIQTQGNESEHVLYGDAVESVDLPRSDQNGMWGVPFTLSSDGAATLQKFAIDTGATKNPNAHELSMYLDESLLFIAPLSPELAASIQKTPLKYFRAEVGTGDAGSLKAKVLYINLQGSALPNNVRVIFSWYG